ncbi:membrane-bound PQQ-dependent dehydrogenase, glucose/quinate/shikimate family [Xenorhabdus bovienii]|uniref:membrane-bound PQQ-dependent dehydrogenase, glucose/quinate/shikimate family n=2 Tax=Xenorhabdus bovienii TaxID=40576 RepID=UPI0023B2815B|nr:membrane-bound PQQ-dependent dehydrogenase, glucose/quinate/shikimate family [Xenorhabdus bovienii]MDE9432285.1 membrane-bound PQQ-dependent dehydrogenase, glucose/quinate/shikimate family [Xenorhabdus bovienii]MDE9462044.1 membrane-bound PQQ-dependent dehydrogenase, glucose/quinate/shikimate family [Xenorhabdus bovienii]MDE9470000.1 membrane-bound PQQ-dependent dehydrogenase, glucose/quinate/shikimate family [Xenorhabdus bovienii]MDE9490246.1 membrane-bound PQQ-dependent dehydrogenase, gluc
MTTSRIVMSVIGGALVLLGAALLLGGVWLIGLGGSWFYAVSGILLTLSGYGFIRQRALGFWAAILLLPSSVVWALFEVGVDFWQLVPRLAVFLVIAFMATAFTSKLYNHNGTPAVAPFVSYSILTSITLAGLIAVISGFYPHVSTSLAMHSQVTERMPAGSNKPTEDWPQYGLDVSGIRYSDITDINTDNVKDLQVKWTYRTGDVPVGDAAFQGTPIKIDEMLYICTPYSKVIALDAETGNERWKFDPKSQTKEWQRCRGLGYFSEPAHIIEASRDQSEKVSCLQRIVLTTIDARLFTLDAHTGIPCPGFGENGYVDLLKGLSRNAIGTYYPTSAPLVAGEIIVTGARMQDWAKRGEPSGVVRGWDVRTGKLVWAWDPAEPKRGKPLLDGETYLDETPNFWGTASYDSELGLVYVPTGNQTPDFWGENRLPASNEYNASIVAIDVKTGIDKWHFRTVNHDLHDYDVAAQPILYDLPRPNGEVIPVVIVLTKRGQIFVLDRRNGVPVFPVEMRKVPTEGAPLGQNPSPKQPYSSLSIGYEPLTEADMWGVTIFDQLYCRIQFKRMHWLGEFTPISTTKTIMYPGYYGGITWGGGAIDVGTNTLIVNDIRMAHWAQFVKHEDAIAAGFTPTGAAGNYAEQRGTPYGVIHGMFISPLGLPCTNPPYGTLSAVDLVSGKILWQVPMGSTEDTPIFRAIAGLHLPIGLPTMAGPLVTKRGVTFFSGSMDYYLRAIDSRSGSELWRSRLPVGSQAAPITYIGKKTRKQFVVVTAGGAQRSDKDRGDYVIAYTLP